MTQENKELLLQDLCARLPYGVVIQEKCVEYDETFLPNKEVDRLINIDAHANSLMTNSGSLYYLDEVKPYLFPLSSMTEEQRIELYKVLGWGYESHYHLSKEWGDFNDSIDNNDLFLPASWVSDLNKMYNWFNKKHFDYRGLIPMGLAIDATGLNIY